MKKAFHLLFFALCLSSSLFATDTTKLPSGMPYTHIAEFIDSNVPRNEKTNAGLSVAIFLGDDILYEGYHGYADKENGIAVDKNTVMEWASVTKLLTWVSVMQLVEKGELSLSKDITEYLPEGFLTKLQYDTPITMYNLMHHNAGWEDSMLESSVSKGKNFSDLESVLHKTEPRQVFKVEEFTAYSNWGTALAGYIVEVITGQPFYEYVHKNIFDVLGMEHTALNADLSDNSWVNEQHNSLKYYYASGKEIDISLMYFSLYPAANATGTLSDLLRFAMALIPDENGKSPLFQKAQTLQDFSATSLYYADGKTPRNSHGLWATSYAVPVIGHAGNSTGCSANLQISPSTGVGVVIMTNQAQEWIYNYGMMPYIFGEEATINTTMSDVTELEGMYLSLRLFSGMLKLANLLSIVPFVKSDDGDTMFQASIRDTKTVLSTGLADFVKISQGAVFFWIATLIFFGIAGIYAFVSLICTLVRRIKHKAPQLFGKLRMLNDISIILSLVNLLIFSLSIASYSTAYYARFEFFMGTYTSVFIQGIFFIIFGLIPVIFTVRWIVSLKKQKIDKKQRIWLILSSIAGLSMTFNVIFWDLYMIW